MPPVQPACPAPQISRRRLGFAVAGLAAGTLAVHPAAAQTPQRDAARLAELGIRVGGQPPTAVTLATVRRVIVGSPERAALWRDSDMAILARLPELEWLFIQQPTGITSAGWQALPRSRTLRLVRLVGARFDRAGVAALASLPALEVLDLTAADGVDDEAAALIARSAARLQVLTLSGSQVTDRGMAALASLPALTTLDLTWVNGLTDAGVARLAAIRTLERLDLSLTGIGSDPRGFVALAALPALESLALTGVELSPGSVAAIARLPVLQHLSLSGIGDAALAPLGALPSLRGLSLAGPEVTDAAMATVARLRGLTQVRLLETSVGDAGVAALRHLALASISLDGSPVGDRGLVALAAIPTLGWISARGTRVTPAGVATALAVPGRHPSLRIER
jgi:hypothetical protein